jgi:hypothetical protein
MRGKLADLVATGIASEPTLRKWITAEPDQPWIIKRGSNGDAYEIEIEDAVRAFKAAEEAKLQAARERSGAIRQIALDLGLGSPDDDGAVELSLVERRQLIEEQYAADKLSRFRDQLVPYDEACAAFGDVLVKFTQTGRTFAARLAKRIDLTREQIAAVDRLMENDLVALADWLEKMEVSSGNDGTLNLRPVAGADVEDQALQVGIDGLSQSGASTPAA